MVNYISDVNNFNYQFLRKKRKNRLENIL